MPHYEDLVADALALEDPAERFQRLGELASGELATHLKHERGRIVAELRNRDPRPTWQEIGRILGISYQRARDLYVETMKETAQP